MQNMSKIFEITVSLFRDGYLESTHNVNCYSNISKESNYFFPRSAVKPFQVIPLLMEADKLGFTLDSDEVAIFASSHSGQDIHTNLIEKIAKKYNLNLEYISCGPQRPFHDISADNYIRKNKEYLNLHNNCSGKHLSMVLFSKLLGVEAENYADRTHLTQKIIEKFFVELFEDREMSFGIDGCGLPAIRVSTANFLKSVVKINSSYTSKYWKLVFDAYNSFPELVGGTNRTDTNIMLHSNEKLLAKSGAEGVLFVTNNIESYIFKCLDGSKRGVDLAATYFLENKGFIDSQPFLNLEKIYSYNMQNNKAVTIKIN